MGMKSTYLNYLSEKNLTNEHLDLVLFYKKKELEK